MNQPRMSATAMSAPLLCLVLAAILVGCVSASPTPDTTASKGTTPPTSSPAETAAPTASPSPPPSPSPSATPFACTAAHGTVVDHAYDSTVAGVSVPYRIYLPPCYETSNRRYPYVILFHGSLDDQTEWTDILEADEVLDEGITAGTLAPMILVMPGGGDLANTSIFTTGKSFESVILDEIVPRVEKQYATFGTREGREIGGISRGGFWAFSIAFRHPDLFSAVGGHSPFFYPTNAPPSSNPLDLVEDLHLSAFKGLRIWVDRGAQDYAEPGITPFVETLEDRKIAHQFKLYPVGQHEIAYWKSHVKVYLAFYGASWSKTVEDLPLR